MSNSHIHYLYFRLLDSQMRTITSGSPLDYSYTFVGPNIYSYKSYFFMAQPFVGEIRQFAGSFAPQGWALCNGQTLPISEYDTLFNLIGTTYGGDGQSTFNLPDLQGRVPVHAGSNFVLGQSGGAESVTLASGELPAHSHPVASSNAGGSDSPAGNVWGKPATIAPYGAAPGNAALNAASISSSGGNQSHENRIPYVAVTYIISLFGIYPSQG